MEEEHQVDTSQLSLTTSEDLHGMMGSVTKSALMYDGRIVWSKKTSVEPVGPSTTLRGYVHKCTLSADKLRLHVDEWFSDGHTDGDPQRITYTVTDLVKAAAKG